MYFVGSERQPGIRGPPQDLLIGFEPGKDALRISAKKRVGFEVSAHCQQAVWFIQRLRGRRKGVKQSQPDSSPSRYFSASSAAIQPKPAEVIACR